MALLFAALLACACTAFPARAHAVTLEELNVTYQAAVLNYEAVMDQQDENVQQITDTQREIDVAQAEMQRAEDSLGETAVELYKNYSNRSDLLALLLESDGFIDMVQRYGVYERMERYYVEQAAELRGREGELNVRVAQLEVKKHMLENLADNARRIMEEAEAALRDADHSDGAAFHQVQGSSSNCGATSFIMGVNVLLHENRFTDNVAVWQGAGFNGDSTFDVTGKGAVWLAVNGLSDQIAIEDVPGDIHTTDKLRAELEQAHVVVISSGSGSTWQRNGGAASPGAFPDGHFMLVYYYADGLYYVNDSSVSSAEGAGVAYTEAQMQQWLDGRYNHFASSLRKL